MHTGTKSRDDFADISLPATLASTFWARVDLTKLSRLLEQGFFVMTALNLQQLLHHGSWDVNEVIGDISARPMTVLMPAEAPCFRGCMGMDGRISTPRGSPRCAADGLLAISICFYQAFKPVPLAGGAGIFFMSAFSVAQSVF